MSLRALLISLLVLVTPVSAQEIGGGVFYPPLQLQEEGAAQGRIRALNCVGGALTCAVSGSTGSVTLTSPIPIANGGTNATSFTNTRIPFFNGTSFADSGNLVWDNTNARLGIQTTPSYPLNVLTVPTATSGTFAAVAPTMVTNPSGASSGAYHGILGSAETFSGNAQNHTVYVTGSGYSVTHRGSGTLGTETGVTLTVATTSAAGAVTLAAGVRGQTSFANTITLATGLTWTPTVTATGAIGTHRGWLTGTPLITAGGAITNNSGGMVENQGATGVTSAAGLVIAAQSGASTGNVGLVMGQSTIPAGAWELYSAGSNPSYIKGKLGLNETAPKSALHITDATTGWIIQDELDANPTTTELDSLDSIAIYSKGGKFVIAYNNGGTMTYVTIPIDGTTGTLTVTGTTTAP